MKKLLLCILGAVLFTGCFRYDKITLDTGEEIEIITESIIPSTPYIDYRCGSYGLDVGDRVIMTSKEPVKILQVESRIVRRRSISDLGKEPNIYNRVVKNNLSK